MPANVLLQKLLLLNIAFVIYNMLPIPPLAGSHMFFASRLGFMFCFGGTIGISVLLLLAKPFVAFLGGIGIAIITWLSFYVFFERIHGWKP